MPYQGIIFDLDGTLVDSFPGIHHSLTRAMEGTGVPPWPLAKTRQTVGHGVEHLVETAVGAEKKKEALRIFQADYRFTCTTKTFLLPGVAKGLRDLRTAGILLAVATNKPLRFTRLILEHLRISTYFAAVMGPDKVGHPKPHPDMIRTLLKELKLKRNQCLYVGDMPLDEETASRAGVDCLLVATGVTPCAALKKQATVPVVRSFSGILPLLKSGSGCHATPGAIRPPAR
jgi:phosphoglycolate phosphatase